MPDEIEGECRELVIRPPERLAALSPEDTIGLATRMATALKDIVEKQKLFAVINGKKYPQVEAWMTIARMDNVVAREVPDGIAALEDGGYEATVELIRLSDGMIVGRGSALCGGLGDEPWHSKRAAPARRSMAVTRATSRAFRQQYSWIMALAGYEPTPAEEMPRDDAPTPDASADDSGEEELLTGRVSRRGIIRKGGPDAYQLLPRETPDGHAIGFRLEVDKDKAIPQVLVAGPIGTALLVAYPDPATLIGTSAAVSGILYNVRNGKGSWYRLHVDRFENADIVLPAEPDPAHAKLASDLAEIEALFPEVEAARQP